MFIQEGNQKMEPLTLYRHEHAASAISLHCSDDILNQFFVLFFPCNAILCIPKGFSQPANRMAKCAERWPVDRPRVVSLNLTPTQKLIKSLYQAASPARIWCEIGIPLQGWRDGN